jgi:hypothetical protein
VEEQQIVSFPTNKPHISFSEFSVWKSCSWKHNLQHVKKITLDKPGLQLAFGKAIHSGCEHYARSKVDPVHKFSEQFKEELDALFAHPRYVSGAVSDSDIETHVMTGTEIMSEFPMFLDTQFPEWQFVDAEHALYENILGVQGVKFKGYIDLVIKTPAKKNKFVTWVLDQKTCQWGWPKEKKEDTTVRSQLLLYRNFWAIKNGLVQRDIRSGFVLLKKVAKTGKRCELFPVSAGDITIDRAMKDVARMIASVKRGVAIKNRKSCKFCEYKDTEWCT